MSEVQQAGRLLTPREAAAVSGLSEKTLANLRCRGGGAPFYRVGGGRFIKYDEHDLNAWVRSRRCTSTSQGAEV